MKRFCLASLLPFLVIGCASEPAAFTQRPPNTLAIPPQAEVLYQSPDGSLVIVGDPESRHHSPIRVQGNTVTVGGK